MRVFYVKNSRFALIALLIFTVMLLSWEGYSSLRGQNEIQVMDPIYQGDTDKRAVALTFNVDWGEEFLPSILTTLEDNNTTATFFITGRFASKYPEIVSEINKKGHEIGNHGYSHHHPDKASKEAIQEEIIKTQEELEQITGESLNKLYAPPYGECESNVIAATEELSYKTIMWTIDTVDWKEGKTPEGIAEKVISKVENGSIVLMHPKEVTAEALPIIIQELKERGYELKSVSQIIPGSNKQNN